MIGVGVVMGDRFGAAQSGAWRAQVVSPAGLLVSVGSPTVN